MATLPNLSTLPSPTMPISVPLEGVTRQGGIVRPNEDSSTGRRRTRDLPSDALPAPTPGDGANHAVLSPTGYGDRSTFYEWFEGYFPRLASLFGSRAPRVHRGTRAARADT